MGVADLVTLAAIG